jgi:hypothetical protein
VGVVEAQGGDGPAPESDPGRWTRLWICLILFITCFFAPV